MIDLNFSITLWILLAALAVVFIAHLYYVLFVHLKLARYRSADEIAKGMKPLSVIIAARNEAENLQTFLPEVLEQDYPNFEVIVVNDRSSDETGSVLRELMTRYSHLRVVDANPHDSFLAGKKFAIAMGIKAARHDWLVFTDADCKPASNQWLQYMQAPDNPNTEILLAYSPYIKQKGLLNALIRFETFFTAINYLSFALKGKPYMGVGRNLAYRKALFFQHKGFAAHMHIRSGDDDLFVNAAATATNTAIQIHPDSHVWTLPNTSLGAYLKQKKRHLGAGKLYKTSDKWMLSTQITVQMAFYCLLIASCITPQGAMFAATVFLLSVLIRAFVYPQLLKKLNNPDLAIWFPFLDILLILFLVMNSFLSIFVKKVHWK